MMKQGKNALLVLSIILLSACSSTKWLNGEWTGTGNQIDGATWAVMLNADVGESIDIKYPSLSCSGTWEVTKKEGDQVWFKESISEGTSNCDQGVEIHATKISNIEMTVLFYLRSYDKEKPIATATLKKKG